jgi:hypothetical protein
MDISLIHRGREEPWWQAISQIESISDTSDDIPNLANVAIRKINQTNPGVTRGIDSLPVSNLQRGGGNGEFA